MSVLTINAFPTTAKITAIYNDTTVTGIGSILINADDGTTVQYKVEADQCTPNPDSGGYNSYTITSTQTIEVVLNYIGSVSVDTWVPSTGKATFPTHIAMLGKGGWREVATIEERNAIPSARREAGMAVYVTSEEKLYILNADLTTWAEFQPEKGGWKEVTTAADRDAIPDDLLEVGMMVYVTSEAKGYILTSLDTTVTPTLKAWSEYKPGQGDYVRKITTYPLSSVAPLVDGEIIQYQGPTIPPCWNGYFYKDTQEYAYISSKSSDMGPASVRIIDEEKLKTYIRANQTVIPGGWSDLELKFIGNYSATCVATNGEVEHNLNSYSTQEQWATIGLQISSLANYPQNGSVAYIAPAHVWTQIDVQPATDLVWGNIEGNITNQTDLQEALDSKLDKSSETEKVYGTDDNGNQVVYSAGDNIEFYNKSPEVFLDSYTEVNSLKANDGQYIDTGINYYEDQKGPTYDITFRYISIEGGQNYNGAVFGARAITGYWGFGVDSFNHEIRIVHGSGNQSSYNETGITTDTDWHRIHSVYDSTVDGGTTYYYYDDQLVFQTTRTFTTSNLNMIVFGTVSESGVSIVSPVEIKSFKLYDNNGDIILDYVPAVDATNVGGFYNRITEDFKVSDSGTAFEIEPFVEEHLINVTDIEPITNIEIDEMWSD